MKLLILLILFLNGCADDSDRIAARYLQEHKKQVAQFQYTHCINGYEFLENINTWSTSTTQIMDSNNNPQACDY